MTEEMGQSGHTVTELPGSASGSASKVKDTNSLSTDWGNSLIAVIARIVITAVMKCWALCTTVLLILLLLYWFYGGLASLVLLFISILGFLYNAQDLLLYYPDQPTNARLYVEAPTIFGLPYENIFIKSSDGIRLHTVLIKQPQPKLTTAPTVIFFHGNAGNIGHRLMNAYALYSYTGANIYLVEYRGYGKSQGKPSEKGLYLDAQAGLDYILKRSDLNQSKMVVFGRSLGGAVAVHVASQSYYAPRLCCLMLENTFTSLPDIARQLFDFKFIRYLPLWCHKNKFASRHRITKTKLPTLFLSGVADDLIPPRMMIELYQHSGSLLKRLAKFPEGTHNETWQCHGYYETVNRFLQEVAEMSTSELTPNSAATYTVDIPFDDLGSPAAAGGVFSL